MAEEKLDMSTVGGDGSRMAGTGIGLATQDGVKSGEASFLDAAIDQLAALDGDDSNVKRKRREPEEIEDVGLDEPEEQEGADEGEGEEEAPDEGIEAEEGEELGDEEADTAKVSIRLDGKKASLEQILDHVGATVVVNGEEIEVSGSELIKGFQRGKDYSEKTTELRRQLDDQMPYNQMVAYAKEDPQFVEYVQSYFKSGPHPEITNNPDLMTSDADLAKMMDPDDREYDASRAAGIVKLRSEWQEQNAGRQQVTARANERAMAQYGDWIHNQIGIATEEINQIGVTQGREKPEYEAKSLQTLEFLKASGYNEAEINGQALVSTQDSRATIIAYKAAEYDRMMRESDAPRVTLGKKRKKIAPPRSQKSGTGGTTTTTSKRQRRDSFRKASKEQTTESWISALEKRLG